MNNIGEGFNNINYKKFIDGFEKNSELVLDEKQKSQVINMRILQNVEDQKEFLNDNIKQELKLQALQDQQRYKVSAKEGDKAKFDSVEEFNIAACADQDQKGKKPVKLECDLIFSTQESRQFIYRDIWRMQDQFTVLEINLYILRVQYVQSVVNECSYDLCIALLISVVAIGLQYIWSSVVAMNIPGGDLSAIFKNSEMKANMTSHALFQPHDLSLFGYPQDQNIVWDGLQEILIICINIYSLNKHNVSENDDMNKEYERMQKLSHLSPYECEYLKKIQ